MAMLLSILANVISIIAGLLFIGFTTYQIVRTIRRNRRMKMLR